MRVLVVDDDPNLRKSISTYLEAEKIECHQAENGLSAQRLLTEQAFDCAVVDLRMPGMSGLELLDWVRDTGIGLPLVMISAFGDVQDAVYALKHGAADYLVKPFDPDELLIRLQRVVEEHQLKQKVATATKEQFDAWWSENPAMLRIQRLIERAAPTKATVLVTGESGTGKEIVAQRIHRLSAYAQGPFVPVNVGAIPDTLLESELFGHERGAFTGADRTRAGLFEAASRGTLFLDEIGEMPLHLQVKLLRVIQDRKIQRIGATRSIAIDVRFIAATNRDLEDLVRDDAFRSDLYYRLNVIRIALPPLRERAEDLSDFISFFIHKLSQRMGKRITGLSREALTTLTGYAFPGNIRELENILERAVILAESDTIQVGDLAMRSPPETAVHRTSAVRKGTLQDIEKHAIIDAMHRWEGKRTAVSEELGISRRTLLNKIKEYGITEWSR